MGFCTKIIGNGIIRNDKIRIFRNAIVALYGGEFDGKTKGNGT